MRLWQILAFVFLLNCSMTLLAGLDVFGWAKSGLGWSPNWSALIGTMVSVSLVTGIFGALRQAAASTVAQLFFSLGAFSLTVQTMSWLEAPAALNAMVSGIIGLLALMNIVSILTGTRLED